MCLMFAFAATAQAQGAPGPRLDPLPHELQPDNWPQPDYFNEALKLTRFKPAERWRALKLAPGAAPDVLVLPVQTQAFGWTPAFRALVGARLDQTLAMRGVKANRQTDLFDADGPYARRFSESEIAAFAAAQPQSAVLALYAGRDGHEVAFLTMTLSRAGQVRRAHRRFLEPTTVEKALEAFSMHLGHMVRELALGAAPPRSRAPLGKPRPCAATDWTLTDPNSGASPADRACHAAIIGTLLPEFDRLSPDMPRPKTADKLPWLAQAWVEAEALRPASAAALRSLVWSQLELREASRVVQAAVDVDDPVIRPLARALWAYLRAVHRPVADTRAARDDYLASAAVGLPPFVGTALVERASFHQEFRRVDLCSLETALPTLPMPPGCANAEPVKRAHTATRSERALLEAWRLAAAFKDLRIQGAERVSATGRQRVLAEMPERLAAHPLIRLERFRTALLDQQTGSFDTLIQRVESAAADAALASAELQRMNSLSWDSAVYTGRWTQNESLRDAPRIKAISLDEERLSYVLRMDGFVWPGEPPPRRASAAALNLLKPGPLQDPSMWQQPSMPPPMPMPPPPVPVSGGAPLPPKVDPFGPFARSPDWRGRGTLERDVQEDPRNMEARSDLATLRLKMGQDVAKTRAWIDEGGDDRRAENAIEESHRWASPAHVFFFSGDLAAARHYYAKVTRIGTYSASDLQARARVRLLDGDLEGAAQASQERTERYENDFARRDLAGLLFALGRRERAWAAITPRLGLSNLSELWLAAMVGQRQEGKSAREVRAWISQSGYDNARIGGIRIGAVHLLRSITEDRTPTADDVVLLGEMAVQQPPDAPTGAFDNLRALALLKRLAVAPQVSAADLQPVDALLGATSDWRGRGAVMPLYAWVAWKATQGQHLNLRHLQRIDLSDDFDALLAKALFLGLEKQPDEALRYLRAARYDLINTTGPLRRDARSAPYMAAFAAWLLHQHTHDERYRAEALFLARAYQRTFPYLSWPYALEAALAPDGPARTTAACRATFLDSGSQFLSASGLRLDKADARCRKAMW